MNSVAQYLKRASDSLKARHPGMSLRAVAARLDVTPSFWSKVLRGERSLSPNLFPRVVRVLRMDVQQIAELQKMLLREVESKKLTPTSGLQLAPAVLGPTHDFKRVGEESFWLLEHWYYIPILNALTLSNPLNPEEIAEKLDLEPRLVEDSLSKMVDAGFVTGSAGVYRRTDLKIRIPTPQRSYEVLRRYHGRMIQRAVLELEKPERFSGRLISSVCFAGSKARLEEAKLILEEAIYKAANLLADSDACDEVFQINVQLFPLTK